MDAGMDESLDFSELEDQLVLELGDIDSKRWISLADCCSMYLPAEDSLSGLYSGGCDDDDSTTSRSTASTRTTRASKNIIEERERRKRLNEKLYAIRGVVPNITKMDKVSIIQDAVTYIEELQEQERRILAEVSNLGCTAVVKSEASTGSEGVEDGDVGFSPRKKMRMIASSSSVDDAVTSPATHPILIFELEVTPIEEKLVAVSIRHDNAQHVMAKMYMALDSLCLKVITTSVTVMGNRSIHTMFIETEEMDSAEMIKEMTQAALSHLELSMREEAHQSCESLTKMNVSKNS